MFGVCWGFLFVFVLCPLPQFEMISKAPDLKKKKRGKKKKALSKVSTVNAVICKELLGRSLSVSMEGGVQHFHWCFCAIVTGWEQDLS